jgi:hypothetical protein
MGFLMIKLAVREGAQETCFIESGCDGTVRRLDRERNDLNQPAIRTRRKRRCYDSWII